VGASDVERRLREQVLYYRRRAAEYDETSVGPKGHGAKRFERWLELLDPGGDGLEIACGTGLWTEHLVRRVRSLTALDSSPEMIELARRRIRGPDATFVVADFFRWRPERRYDCAFFGFWLSHVPPQRFADFWRRLARCLEPGGRALFVDEGAGRAPRDADPEGPFIERRLRDGSTYRIVKVFHEPDALVRALAEVGWTARIDPLEDGFLAGVARPTRRPAG
jgi:demethylmenaquinone methyltransferase/2-methoxy-6-polyprenyl-1,4-benzoquinol methylase